MNKYKKAFNTICDALDYYMVRKDLKLVPSDNEIYGAMALLRKLVNKADSFEWIPASERLPEDNQIVLTSKNNSISILKYHADTKHWYETNGNWGWSFNMVDAWMPLPKPYKEKENE